MASKHLDQHENDFLDYYGGNPVYGAVDAARRGGCGRDGAWQSHTQRRGQNHPAA